MVVFATCTVESTLYELRIFIPRGQFNSFLFYPEDGPAGTGQKIHVHDIGRFHCMFYSCYQGCYAHNTGNNILSVCVCVCVCAHCEAA